MKRFLKLRRKRDELGVVAIIAALLALVLLMFAAYAIDIGMQVSRKHQLHDTLDAAAQAGAFELPGSSITAKAKALEFAYAHDPTETGSLIPNVDFWCVVASKLVAGVRVVDPLDIPATCNPGTTPYTPGVNYKTTGRMVACSSLICAIPCVEPTPNNGTPPIACNTIRVYQGRAVPFGFAAAGGIPQGQTGNVISVACKGSCGTVPPNPMDVAIVADRTVSMGTADLTKLVAGIKGMLQVMTPSMQYVSLGTIGRSAPATASQTGACSGTGTGLTAPSTSGTTGRWMPVSFSNNYVDGSQTLNTSSALFKGVDCLMRESAADQGTTLASPMKAAARYLLGTDPNNLSSLPNNRTPTPNKVLIFETDGQPNERTPVNPTLPLTAGVGSNSLGDSTDIFSHPLRTSTVGIPVLPNPADTSVLTTPAGKRVTTITHNRTVAYEYNGGANACQNLIDVAANAKAAGIIVIMIGYNMAPVISPAVPVAPQQVGQPKKCQDYDGVKSDYSNLSGPYTGTGTVTTVANPSEDPPDAACPAPNASKTCQTRHQTTTTTTYQRGATSTSVLSVMAQAASPTRGEVPVPSVAQNDCSTQALRDTENADGDFLFCASSGTDMAPIFRTALGQVSKGIKLIKIP
jgi:hypothetical protein